MQGLASFAVCLGHFWNLSSVSRASTDLQQLQVLADVFLRVIVGSTRKMPYGMRFVVHEILAALRVRSLISAML